MLRNTTKKIHNKRTHNKRAHSKRAHSKRAHKKTYKGGFRYGRQNNLRTPIPGEILVTRSPIKSSHVRKYY